MISKLVEQLKEAGVTEDAATRIVEIIVEMNKEQERRIKWLLEDHSLHLASKPKPNFIGKLLQKLRLPRAG